jgi:eukaryotic-like serine/threonine-protein kinase
MRELPIELTEALSARYRFVRELGAGGMAIVYLAHDLKHGRDVAVKVLKPEVALAIGIQRFQAEIRLTGNLKHPHILPLFDSGSAGSLLFYVMPFIEGGSLSTRLRRGGRFPVAEVIHILRQVADALSYAHNAHVIHRDLKPDNILFSGRHIFLADFGIARLQTTSTSAPTMTCTGAMAGTPGYMAPEQIVGSGIDHRCDIYALGVLGYELLAGAPPFTGTRQEVIAAQLTRSPEALTRMRPDTPALLAALVMRSLEKRPEDRWQRGEDIQAALDGMENQGIPEAPPERFYRPRALLVTVAILLAVAAVGLWRTLRKGTAPPEFAVGRITHLTSEPGLELDPAIGPDGRMIAYVAGLPGRQRVVLRQITGSQIVPLLDDRFEEVQRWPQWSPDGSHIVFQTGRRTWSGQVSVAGGAIYEAPALGGTARRVTESGEKSASRTPSYSPDGRQMVYAENDGLYVIDSSAGARRLIADAAAHSPRWSPDGSMIVYVHGGVVFSLGEEMLGNIETSSLRVVVTKTGRANQITTGDWLNTSPVWMPQGRKLLFVSNRGGSPDIYSIRLKPGGEADGEPQRLTSGLNANGISLSRDGKVLAYSAFSPSNTIWCIDIPSKGVASVRQARQLSFANEEIEKVTISPDGKWLAYDSDRNGPSDIWKMPAAGGAPEQITQGLNHKFVNDWSPDGRELVYHAMRNGGQRDLFVVSADGTHTEAVTATPREEEHAGWGPDGNSLVFDVLPPGGSLETAEAYVVTRARRGAPWGTPRQLTTHGSSDPKWSPDGRLIAFCAGGELRLIAPDGTGERVIVPSTPDRPQPSYPIWSKDGHSIYFKAYDRDRNSTIWSVPVTGGPARLLIRFDDPSRRSLRREFATDGVRFYFTVARYESDIWTMELLNK